MAAVQVPVELYWTVAAVLTIGAISTVVKIKAARWLKEKKRREREELQAAKKALRDSGRRR